MRMALPFSSGSHSKLILPRVSSGRTLSCWEVSFPSVQTRLADCSGGLRLFASEMSHCSSLISSELAWCLSAPSFQWSNFLP